MKKEEPIFTAKDIAWQEVQPSNQPPILAGLSFCPSK
eukprot:CAMPEP_0183299354 /NCGR_PEP_ID=MMETSP0160_2-20130417/6111_1 /TAXON_ID=2839 ORGANISM="Odontella Sinensis, Strain Grunow 1884" /NCGR_SAMPLE_ID=MMETSP0160_2 /ASSEMBLY_ACC=CAM_ASM_000250 /LENGTH=36 /DNA_ID= /DNA_START= /DNA_END= /DNA_ORIENTATION=